MAFDAEKLADEINAILWAGLPLHGTESMLVNSFLGLESAGHHEEAIGMSAGDIIKTEVKLPKGRADLVVSHIDGTITVIEAKDGSNGYAHVAAGIGQVCLYAAQLSLARNSGVRRALLWSSTGDAATDLFLHKACDDAGVVSIGWPHIKKVAVIIKAAERLQVAE